MFTYFKKGKIAIMSKRVIINLPFSINQFCHKWDQIPNFLSLAISKMYKISFVLNNDDACVGLQVSLIDFTMLKLCIYYLYIVQR